MKYISLINAVVIVDLFPNAGPEFTLLDMCHLKALVQRCMCAERICGSILQGIDANCDRKMTVWLKAHKLITQRNP